MANGEKDHVTAWLEFLQSLIWPLIVMVIVVLLRHDIGSVLGRVSKVNFAGASIEMTEALSQIDKQIESKTAPTANPLQDTPASPEIKALAATKHQLIASTR